MKDEEYDGITDRLDRLIEIAEAQRAAQERTAELLDDVLHAWRMALDADGRLYVVVADR